ncbi:MFS transporter [Loktanella sp. M215]|uniref:MFS transporter n=1 Tax=Loktanella sp. M215 TaxID=2675431 RepID=UPI001F02A34F|nr:MFS transporter [Loktanella sp. M215]MCF7701450.1 MFS transporter [Loktanella sp. M215]
MIHAFRLTLRDPTLRLMLLAMLLHGGFAASVGSFQSLIAVTVFGLSDNGYALILAASLMVSVTASIGVGILTDQRPSRRAMALCAAGTMCAGALLVLAGQSATAFVLAHVLLLPVTGTLFGQLFAVARLVTAPLPRADRDGIMAIIRATFALPFVVLLAIWGVLFDAGVPLIAVYGWTALSGALLMVLILTRWPRDAQAPWTEVKSGLGFRASLSELTHGPVLLRVGLVGAIHSGAALSGVIIGLLLNAVPGRGAGDVGAFFAIFVAIEIAVTLSVGALRRSFRRLHIIAAGVFIYAAGMALLPVLADGPGLWLLCLPYGMGGAMIYALAIGYLQDLLGSRAGAGASLLALQQIAAQGLGALVFAVGAALGGYGLAAVIGATVMAIAMVAILWLDRNAPLEP